MDDLIKNIFWSQFGAAIDTLENAVKACPVEVWEDQTGETFRHYWYIAYHTIFWLDYYLSNNHKEFKPPEPYTMSEFDPKGAFPERIYTQDEMLAYLEHCREKCRAVIRNIDDKWVKREYEFLKGNLNFGELLLYSMRHVQHHSAQLNLLLRQKCDLGSPWVFTAKKALN